MPPKNNQTVGGTQNDSGIEMEDTVSTADYIHIKGQVENIKQKRNAKRESQEASLKAAARELHARIEEQGAVRSKEIEMAQSQRVTSLTRAMEKRYELEKAIAAKLEESQREFANLTNLIESVYDGRLEELRKATLAPPQVPHDERVEHDS